MENELVHLHKALDDPKRPVMAVVGGAKVSTKIALLENLVEARGDAGDRRRHGQHVPGRGRHNVGKSLYEPDHLETARRVIALSTKPVPL